MEFVREAEKLGLQKLVMPIYWRTVPELESQPEASTDAAIRVILTYQWKDFRIARLEDEESSVFRKAVDDLAEELVKRASEAEIVDDVPMPVTHGVEVAGLEGTEDEEPGLLEKLAVGEDPLPKITEVVERFGAELTVIGEVAHNADAAFRAAASKGANARAGLVVTERFARELDAPAKRIEELGSEFTARLGELDAAIEAQFDVWSGSSDPMEPRVREELESTAQLAATVEQVSNQLEEVIASTAPLVRMSRSLRAPIRHLRNGLQSIVDGRRTMGRWTEWATEILVAGDS